MSERHIVIIGAGPGGLAAAMILAYRGFKVTVFEKENSVGGRNRALNLGKHVFDIGPTFLMMDFFLREIFTRSGKNIEDYLQLTRLEPIYKLSFIDKELYAVTDHDEMRSRIARTFPGNEGGFDRFLREEHRRYDKMFPCLKKHYSTITKMLHPDLISALPWLSLGKSLYRNLSRYYTNELCKLSFTFQAKYLGMSPWSCPGLFTIIPYIEHAYGVYHVTGGLCTIADAMQRVAREHGAVIYTQQRVKRILSDSRRHVQGVLLNNDEKVTADGVVINADFGHAAESLFLPGELRKYTPERMSKMQYSCSTFMLYLALNTVYPEPHHQIIFARDYHKNITDISTNGILSDDMSIYLRNGSVLDKTLAPDGHSAVYVLVPVPNLRSHIIWNNDLIATYREKVLTRIEQRTSMTNLRSHIVAEHIITPQNWWADFAIFHGATFNLAHNLLQMLYFRPHNRFEEFKNCYLVGGGTHPGSGLPTIYESARITADLICQDYKK